MPARARATLALALALVCALAAGLVAYPASATHTFPRKLTIKHKRGKLKGKLRSPSRECRAGVVAVHRYRKRGADPIVASDRAKRGRWSVRAPKRGRFYASAESFVGSAGRCPDVNSKLIRVR